jgi:Outer membrane lipoprotein-sorting protein
MNYFLKLTAAVAIIVQLLLPLTSNCATTKPSLKKNDSPTTLPSLLANYQSLQANFIQLTTDSTGSSLGEKITGTLLIQRPGKLKWETFHPHQQLIIINEGIATTYTKDLAQAIKKKIDLSAKTPASLLLGNANSLRQLFIMDRLPTTAGKELFLLKPKDPDADFLWIKTSFQQGVIKNMIIKDKLDQQTIIHFEKIKLNPVIADKSFIFIPPPDTEVLENF